MSSCISDDIVLKTTQYLQHGGTATLACSADTNFTVIWERVPEDIKYAKNEYINSKLINKISVTGNHSNYEYNLEISNLEIVFF